MKASVLLLSLFSIFISSCNFFENKNNEIIEETVGIDSLLTENSDNDVVIEEENDVKDISEDDMEAMEMLNSLPANWTMLTKDEETNEDYILEPCEVQNPTINIMTESSTIGVGLGQDVLIFTIIDIKKTADTTMSKDSLLITTKCDRIDGSLVVKFVWDDEENGIAKWNIPTCFNTRFVDNDKKNSYDIVKEECDEMW